MKKRILLISPNLKGIKGGINRIQPGLGIGYIAASLEKAGYEVYVYDSALEGFNNKKVLEDGKTILVGASDSQLKSYIKNLNPSVVGISVLFSNLAEHAHTIAKIVKEINPKTTVFMGGNHISNAVSDYKYALANPESKIAKKIIDLDDPHIDYAMIGEGEVAVVNFVNAITRNEKLDQLSGLVYKSGDNYIINKKPCLIDIKNIPLPARHLMDMESYFDIGLFHSSKSKSNRVLNVMAARGCPEKCTFCTTPEMWGQNLRWREPEDIYEEIKYGIDRYGIKEVQFEDDTLTSNYQNLMRLCDLIEPLNIDWCTPNGIKVNYFQEQQIKMFKRMAESGCYQVTLACESGSQRVLDEIIGKRLNVDQIAPAVTKAKEAGLFVHTFWIVGFPGETKKEMEQTIKVAASTGADSFSVSILTPLPGSPIYRKIVDENLWWNPNTKLDQIMYRNSLVKVDGFDSASEFENWVNEQNHYLNSLIEKNAPERAKKREELIHNKNFAHLKVKQT